MAAPGKLGGGSSGIVVSDYRVGILPVFSLNNLLESSLFKSSWNHNFVSERASASANFLLSLIFEVN